MNITATVTNALLCLALALGVLPVQMGTVHATSSVVSESSIQRPAVPGPIESPSTASVRFVAPAGSDPASLCATSGAPCRTIQRALSVAQDGDEIRVAAGVYTGSMTSPFSATLVISNSISLLGGYSSDFSSRAPLTYVTTVDGQQRLASVVAIIRGNVLVDGLTIINGRAPNGGGVGIFRYYPAEPVTVTLSNNVIANNRTYDQPALEPNGAGILITGAVSVTVASNAIYSNVVEARGFGGGISIRFGATALITGNQILSNTVPVDKTDSGIGIYLASARIVGNLLQGNQGNTIGAYDNTSLSIEDNRILSNTTRMNAAGIGIGTVYGLPPSEGRIITVTGNEIAYNRIISDPSPSLAAQFFSGAGLRLSSGANVLLEGNRIHHNGLDRERANGAGVRVDSLARVTARNNEISFNTTLTNTPNASSRMAGISLGDDASESLIEGNRFEGNNSASINLGHANGTMIVRNNIFVANTAEIGAGIHFNNGYGSNHAFVDPQAIISGNTFVSNVARWQGNAIFVGWGATSTFTISNNIFTGNGVTDGTSAIEIDSGNPAGIIAENIFSGNVAQYGAAINLKNTQNSSRLIAISGNSFEGNASTNGPSTISIDKPQQVSINGNRFFRNASYAPSYVPSTVQVNQPNSNRPVTLTNNIWFSNTGVGLSFGWEGTTAVRIRNNDFISNTAHGIESYADASVYTLPLKIAVENNLFAGNGWCSVSASNSYTNTLRNNLFFNDPPCANVTEVGSIVGDPLFANLAAGDFHLRPSSPAIDAADPTYAPPRDHDGLPRPIGAGSDIGAFEYPGNRHAFLAMVLR